MIEIKTSLGESDVMCIGTGTMLLAEAVSIVNALYATFKKRMDKRVADAFAEMTMQQLANLKEDRSTLFEDKDEGECSKPEEKREPGEADLSDAKCRLAIKALEELRALIDESKKED